MDFLAVGRSYAFMLCGILVAQQMRVPATRRKELSQAIVSLIGSQRTETRCRCCDFYRNLVDEGVYSTKQPNRRKTMKSSTKDKAEGKMHQVKGKIKETGGKAVGNEDLEAEGKGENLEGEVQEKVGDVKKVFGK
jgi:uncharacterized protein YjbJ (UPF0337 family)